jgi:hypothetical protein
VAARTLSELPLLPLAPALARLAAREDESTAGGVVTLAYGRRSAAEEKHAP